MLGFRLHIDNEIVHYGEQVLVDLVSIGLQSAGLQV